MTGTSSPMALHTKMEMMMLVMVMVMTAMVTVIVVVHDGDVRWRRLPQSAYWHVCVVARREERTTYFIGDFVGLCSKITLL